MTESLSANIPVTAASTPRHVAIIMDGNNRWAKLRRLAGVAGHKAGVNAVRSTVETCAQNGVEVLTLFAFSSENWRRPKDEVSALMRLFLMALEREVRKLHRNNIRLRIIGDRSAFNDKLQAHMARAEELTAGNTRMTLVIAANYGGHWDITQAAQSLARDVQNGLLQPGDITDEHLQKRLCIGDLPMPDLLIRTAGEQRISNFLLWHLAYTEFHFSNVFWPDFDEREMLAALEAYAGRKRRFGQTDDQLEKAAATGSESK
ncbi:di-trans,poly-cis-decaprenylcistransferase [Marinobacter halodurans]|uniref:Ditrans,polycis-undecaprenyl-diphosphate synthase ((2E,6E)-farnesyl-diphosphate specific) n=1 Tax=Marinobacter halodurans TaxID=2528979 RepID=A0ABY1ZNH9_9GAMM|nr:polyprenyl diphosphate synthase [Marinobacter halodurans]TBW56679.1 di-trans,poly-cis-decaprenylcistransferase [Marinobacter halodurans]